jgi:undecaprenyl diphosphate synthase
VQNNNIPNHVGLILDGNRRWAEKKGLPKLEGHRVGAENMKVIADHMFDLGVKYLSAYIFSTENWNRSKEEVNYLMKKIMPIVFRKYLGHFNEKGVKILWLGSKDRLDEEEIELVENAVEVTKNNKEGTLCFCFNYGGKQEIVESVKSIVESGIKNSDEVTEALITKNIYSPEVPDIDLIIRTSGEQRISDFMLWRAGYSELIFVDKFWPDFKNEDLDEAFSVFEKRKRRFGC